VTTFVFPTSVVTASEAEAMVMGLLTSKVQETCLEMSSAANGLQAITARLLDINGKSQHEADTEFANLDAQLNRLLALRHTLQNRVDAHLSQQRIAADVAAHIQTKVA
jgi:hypothetical protein